MRRVARKMGISRNTVRKHLEALIHPRMICSLSSSGDTTTQGLVFRISLPSVGSNETK